MTPKEYVRRQIGHYLAHLPISKKTIVVSLLGGSLEELEKYDRLGIARRNIWMVERDPDVADVARDTCRGINLFVGDLDDFANRALVHKMKRIDFLNADFHGSFWHYRQSLNFLFELCIKSDVGAVAITSLDRRDDLFLGVGQIALDRLMAMLGRATIQLWQKYLSQQYRSANLPPVIARSLVHRDLAMVWWLAIELGELNLTYGNRYVITKLKRYCYQSSAQSTMRTWLFRFEKRRVAPSHELALIGLLNMLDGSFRYVE